MQNGRPTRLSVTRLNCIAPASQAVLASGPGVARFFVDQLVVTSGFFQHPAQVTILAAGRFEVEHQVLDAQAQVIQ